MSQAILRLTALENDSVAVNEVDFALDEQIRQVIVGLSGAWEDKNIEWQLDLQEINLHTDEELIRQVWVNLIQNAVKFSDPGSSIAISALREGSWCVVKVQDHGCGMNDETMSRIFDQFFQADRSRSREGIGLGLSLVKRILQILGGKVDVDSTVGQGSTFTVRLPL